MSEGASFTDLIRRLRAGDARAAEELFRLYEPFVRREVRLRMNDPSLNPLFDSVDVCQSVLKSFFLRTAAGQYDLESPRQLQELLARMARNKLGMHERAHRRQRRDRRRTAGEADVEVAAGGPTPERVALHKDLLEEVRRRLTDDERRLADRRAEGKTWPEIADEVGGTAQARRRQLTRGLDRVAAELHLDDIDP